MFEGINTFIDLIGKNTYFDFTDETGAISKIVLQVFNNPLITQNSTFGRSSRFLLLSCFLSVIKFASLLIKLWSLKKTVYIIKN